MTKDLHMLARKIRLLIGLGIVKRGEDTGRLQRLQIALLGDEVRDDVNRYQNYGFVSRPLPGAEAITASVSGSRNHLAAIVVDDGRHRKRDLQEGESAMYTDEGDYILLKRGRVIEVVAGAKLLVNSPEVEIVASTKVTLQTPECEITGNLTVGGNVSVTGQLDAAAEVTGGGKALSTHTHIGTQPGSGTSGPPA